MESHHTLKTSDIFVQSSSFKASETTFLEETNFPTPGYTLQSNLLITNQRHTQDITPLLQRKPIASQQSANVNVGIFEQSLEGPEINSIPQIV